MTGAHAPDPSADTAELARLDAQIPGLQARAVQAHQGFVAADAAHRAAVAQRGLVAARLSAPPRRAPPLPAPAPVVVPAVPPAAPSVPAPETSTRTVQNLLFILGGLLLGTAAIAFTAVAWATFGVGGRAAILAVVTLIALAIPLVALARRLRATAETFAAIGLLLVVLDGYAAWFVNLGHVQAMPGSRYAGIVAVVTAVVGYGYRRATRLVGPAVMALLAAQPALVLIVGSADPSAAAVSLVAAATAGLNLFAIARSRAAAAAPPAAPALGSAAAIGLQTIGWVFFAVWLCVAGGAALIAESSGLTTVDLAWAGLSTVVVGLALLGAAWVARQSVFVLLASAALVGAVAIAVTVLANHLWPNHAELLCAAVALVVGLAVLAVKRLLPVGVRPGPSAGALVVAGLIGLVMVTITLYSTALTIGSASPLWHAPLAATGPHPPVRTWELPLSLVVLAVALILNAPQWTRTGVAVGTAVVVVLALPSAASLQWWVPALLSLVAAAVLLGFSVLSRTMRDHLLAGLGGAVLLGDAVLTAGARPWLTALVLTGIAGVGVLITALAGRATSTVDRQAIVGFTALVGLMAVPPAVGSALVAAHVQPWWAVRATVAAVLVPVLATAFFSRRAFATSVPPASVDGAADSSDPGSGPWSMPTVLAGAAFVATLLGVVIWPWVAVTVGAESIGVYAGISLLLIAGVLAAGRSAGALRVGVLVAAACAAAPGGVALAVVVVPSVLVVAAGPYQWLTAIWSGRPVGVGLAPDGTENVHIADAVALALLAIACATAIYAVTRRLRPAWGGFGVGGPTAILVALTAWGAVWPAVPAATLLLGLVLVLAGALGGVTRWRAAVAVGQGIVYIGAGIAGSLGVEWATLTAVGTLVVAGAVIGTVGWTVEWRVTGLLVAVGAAVAEAAIAGAAADVSARNTAFWILGVAVVVLFLGALLGRSGGRRAESTATQAAAHAAAAVSLLFTVGWREHAALVCAVWGIAVGLRALLPGTSRPARATLAAAAAAFELLAWWLLLLNRGVTFVEAYTLPLAVVALLAGWAALRSRPNLGSWVAYGPALVAAFLPTLAVVLGTTGDPWRRLALGAGALAVVVAGSVSRRRAPVVIGGVTLVLVALHELVLLYQLLPGWVALAAGGVILVVLAVTYERRLRDLGRLRSSLQRMT